MPVADEVALYNCLDHITIVRAAVKVVVGSIIQFASHVCDISNNISALLDHHDTFNVTVRRMEEQAYPRMANIWTQGEHERMSHGPALTLHWIVKRDR